ncbi:MAG: efflux RND transporter periplasmic adaptor subunit, partial [Deltaproteobacteria bacterium]|nr:efflux RND transporter periplasmic adaptor subunit [Deltaproteobacteria bacterium]
VDVGTPLVSVVQVSPVKVELRIFEKYKTSIKSDMDISVTVAAYPGEIFFGTICFVSPEVDPATRTFLIKALIANADRRLSPGMFAQVSMVHAVHNSALIVPWEAVVQLEDRAFVFTVEQGVARRVPVTVLKQFDDSAEVVGKLEPGRQVIIEGKFTVNEGDTLAVKP